MLTIACMLFYLEFDDVRYNQLLMNFSLNTWMNDFDVCHIIMDILLLLLVYYYNDWKKQNVGR